MNDHTFLPLRSFSFASGQASPIPPFRDIPAGFDAIFQTRSDVLEQLLVAATPLLQCDIPYPELSLPPRTQEAVDTAVSQQLLHMNASLADVVLADKFGITSTVEPSSLRVAFYDPGIHLRDKQKISAQVHWDVSVELVLTRERDTSSLKDILEKAFGPHLGEPPTTPPPGWDKLLEAGPSASVVKIAGGRVLVDATIATVSSSPTYTTHAEIAFSNQDPEVVPWDDVFSELLQQEISPSRRLQDIITTVLSDVINTAPKRITPEFSLFGKLKPGEPSHTLPRFAVQLAASPSNDAVHWALSICVNVRPEGADGLASLVRPFLGNGNLAAFLSEEIMEASLRNRWSRPDTPKAIDGEIPIHEPASGASAPKYLGRARVKVTLRALDHAMIRPSVSQKGDEIQIVGQQEIRLLRLWNDQDVELSLTELRGTEWEGVNDPVDEPFALVVLPFADIGADLTHQGTAFLHQKLGPPLLEPLYRPMQDNFPMLNIFGHTSAASRGVFLRGDLDVSMAGIAFILSHGSVAGWTQ